MLIADHLRLDNVLSPIKEIASVTQNWAYGFDIVTINLTCGNNKPRYIHLTMKLDGGWNKGFDKAIESFTNELRLYHKCLVPSELKEDILIRSLIKQLEEIRVAPYDYEAADKAHLEEIHRFGHRPPRF